jgi:putative FmdB family regulatory protein
VPGGIAVPTYQYLCTNCGEDIEVVQKFSDAALTTHEACGGQLRKVFSPVGIVFKGSGFYRTDSRGSSSVTSTNGSNGSGDGSSKTDSADKSDKSDKSQKSESKSESKSTSESKPASSSTTKVA